MSINSKALFDDVLQQLNYLHNKSFDCTSIMQQSASYKTW